MSAGDLISIQKIFLKLEPGFNLKTSLLFIFDEIHKIAGWENYVIDLSRNPAWKVIVTGSSSKLLKFEVGAELRGKSISSEIYPLSFAEFLRFKSFKGKAVSTKGEAEIMRLFDEYLKWGAFPAMSLCDELLQRSPAPRIF